MKVEHANEIILNPYITEKTFELVETEKKICFIVEKTASKSAIKDAINTLYEQNVMAGTVHRHQGNEKDIMIIDTVDSIGGDTQLGPWANADEPSTLKEALNKVPPPTQGPVISRQKSRHKPA